MELELCDFNKKTGRWSWPPKTKDGRTPFATTLERYEEILRVLAEGPVVEKRGRASAKLQGKLNLAPVSQAHMNHVLRDLDDLGFVQREVNGRHTKRIELAVPVEQLPMSIRVLKPPPPTHQEPEPKELGPIPGVTAEEGDAFIAAATGADEPRREPAFNYTKLAHTLLDEVVRRAEQPNTEGIELLQQRLDKLIEVRAKTQQELDKALEKNRQLVLRLEEAQMKNKQLERNLSAALGAARDMAARAPANVREETLRGVERLMQRSRED